MNTDIIKPTFFQDSNNSFSGSIYRYISNFDYIKEAITTKNIYMTNPQNFNDPFDCGFNFTQEAMIHMHCRPSLIQSLLQNWMPEDINEKILLYIKSNNDNFLIVDDIIKIIGGLSQNNSKMDYFAIKNLLWIQFKINDFLKRNKQKIIFDNNIRVCCFSKKRNSFPMWAHYAKNHSGVCLEYDTKLLSQSNQIIKDAIVNVQYNKTYITDDITNYFRYFNKSDQWKYEEEVRIVCKMTGNYLNFPCLKSVYLGINIDHEKRNEIIDLALDNNVDVWDAEIDSGNQYDLSFVADGEVMKARFDRGMN